MKKAKFSLFNKLSTIYKGVDPDSVEGKYIADMRKAVKPIRDAFMEGAAQASKNAEAKKAKSDSKGEEKVDTNSRTRYNKSRTPYNSFATEAMKWAHSDRTDIGAQKFFNKNGKWVLLEKSNDGYVEMGSYTNKQRKTFIEEIIARNEELHNRRRDGEIRADIDGYRNVKDEYSRYFADDMGQSRGNGQSSRLHRGESPSNRVTDNKSGKSGGRSEIKHKSRSSVGKYTLKEYNNYGWARANDVLSAKENTKLRSLFADAVSKQSNPLITKSGEYMIAIGEDVDNKIAYMEGTIDDPKITKVLAIDEYDETQLDKARRNIYDLERRGIQQKTQGVFRLYREADFGSYADFTRNVERDKQNYLQLRTDRGTGSGATPKVKEILFDDEGNEVIRIVRSKARTSYTSGQMAKMKANLSQQKVYSKADTMKLVKELAPGIRKRSFDMLTEKLWEGFNTYTTSADRRIFANDMAV